MARPIIQIELWRRRVHLLSAMFVLDLHERMLRPISHQEELSPACAFVVVATRDDLRILAAAVDRRSPTEAAVSSLDRAVEALASHDRLARAEFWKLHSDRIVVVTDGRAPFSSLRFVEAVRDLGCVHQVRKTRSG